MSDKVLKKVEGSRLTMILELTQFCDGSAYLSHMERIRGARGDTLPESAYEIPLMYQAVSDKFLPWCADIPAHPYEYKVDFEAEVGVIVDRVPMGISVEDAGKHIKYVTIINDISLRTFCAKEVLTGFGFLQGKPHSALGKWSIPVSALEDEVWHDNKFHATMIVELNGEQIGKISTSKGMHFDFAQLIVHAAKTRELSKGSLIGGGTVSSSNINDGFGCLMERSIITDNKEYLKSGDNIKMYIKEFSDHLLIEQRVA
ncbi:MAG: 2-keto-4-pentenoate hydratase [Methanobacteriota archaeon]|jgi:fumarylacetoacetate (FAA) hydrolase|nr:MAG: 2-keto-4-pentenoate hydratase [Euryarchaeota archaeon]